VCCRRQPHPSAACKQTNTQASKQTNKQTNKQASKQTNKQTNKQTSAGRSALLPSRAPQDPLVPARCSKQDACMLDTKRMRGSGTSHTIGSRDHIFAQGLL
jgi:hypothetical protein